MMESRSVLLQHPDPAHFSAHPLPPSQSTATLPSATTRFSREFNLLVACVNGAETKDIRKLICDDLDWHSLLRLTEHHRLIPQVYAKLCDADDLVPRATSERLRNRYEANVRQALRLTRDLVRVLEHFESRGIPVLAYKGPTLAAILHGDFTQRQYSDLDLLVHPSDIENSKSALLELGYKPGRSLTTRQEESYIRSGYEYVFDLPDARNILELKWRILPHFYSIEFDVSGLFDRSVVVDVSGHSMRTLCAEDLLLVLCVHAAKHAWSELSLLWDVSRYVESQSIDWEHVREQASQLGIRRILDMNLTLAQNLLGNPVPSAGHEQAESERVIGLLMKRVLPVTTHAQQVDTESISYFRQMLAVRERWQDRVRFLWRLLVTPNIGEWLTVRLPSWLFPLYHLVRMYRLARRLMGFLATRETEAEIPRPSPI